MRGNDVPSEAEKHTRAYAPQPYKQLRDRRNEVGISQLDLAALAGVGGSTVKAMEGGRGVLAPSSRVLPAIERALGLAPSGTGYGLFADDPRAYIRPVASATAVRAVADAVLPAIDGGVDGDRLRVEWHGVVNGLAADPPYLSDGFGYLRARMRGSLPPDRVRAFDDEVRARVGERWWREVPDSPALVDPDAARRVLDAFDARAGMSGEASLSAQAQVVRGRPEEQVVRASGLPDELQAHLLAYAARRRESLEAELLKDLADFIELVRRTLPPQ